MRLPIESQNTVFAIIVAATLAAAAVVTFDPLGGDAGRASREQFQNLLGGLGMGSHTDLSRCPCLFDPRVAGDDRAALDCLFDEPGECGWHALSVFPAPITNWDDPILPHSASGEPGPDRADKE